MTGGPHLTVVAGPAECAAAAAAVLIERGRLAIAERGEFALVLAGGSTPQTMFTRVAEDRALHGALDWSRVQVFWGDERAVPPDDPGSNYGQARDFLVRMQVPPTGIRRIEGERGPAAAAARYQAVLESWGRRRAVAPLFDLMFLGVGEDGHTASLFPGSEGYREALRRDPAVLVVAGEAPVTPRSRISLTLCAMERAELVVFVATGEAKAAVVAAAVSGPPDPAVPASMVRSRAPGAVRWLVDRAAGSRLDDPDAVRSLSGR